MNRYLKYTLKGLAVLTGILLIVYILVFVYVSSNKQKIITQVTQEVSKKLSGNVSIGDVELSFFSHFPRISVVLTKILLTDTLFQKHHHPFFQADKVYLSLNMLKLIQRDPAISGMQLDNGSFYVFTDTTGYTNSYLYKVKKDTAASTSTSTLKNELKYIELKDVRITIDDQPKNKLHDFVVHFLNVNLVDRDTSFLIFSTKADILIHSLAFNVSSGSFVKDKTLTGTFDIGFDKKRKQLELDSIDFKLSGQPFNVTGSFDLAGPDPQFMLKVHTKDMLYDYAKSLLTAKIVKAVSIVDLDKKINVDARMVGSLNGGDPLILVNWAIKDTHLKTPFLDFDEASLKGYYTNEVVAGVERIDPNSKIVVTDFSADWQGFPITADKIEIMNLFLPEMTCDLKSSFDLATLNDLIGSQVIHMQSGTGTADLTYKGPLQKNDNTNSFVNGEIVFKNGSALYSSRNTNLQNINGKIIFKNSDLNIEKLQCIVLDNKIIMDAQAKNLLTLINTEPSKVKLNWNIYSPSLNLASFTYLLQSGQKVANKSHGKQRLAKLAQIVDKVIDEGSFDVNLRAAHLQYKKFQASNVLASISLIQNRYAINKVSMEQGGGRMDLKGSLTQVNKNKGTDNQVNLSVLMNNVDVSKLFNSFDNFGQDGITSENLEGQLSAKVNVALGLDNDGKVIPSSVESVVDFSLKNGALNNYEPIKKLQNILFKHRDFDNIRFAELKDKLEIKNQEIKINRMEIQSNVLSMFVEGVYSNKGNTDMSIQVPFNNLKKRGMDYNPENIGSDKKGGHGIFIRGRPGADGKVKFKIDLFNKYKKDNTTVTSSP